VPAPGDCDDAEIGGMISRGNRSTWRKPVPVPLCPPQIPHAVRTRTQAVTVGSPRLAARPCVDAQLMYSFPSAHVCIMRVNSCITGCNLFVYIGIAYIIIIICSGII
jgi:hypothetical protein